MENKANNKKKSFKKIIANAPQKARQIAFKKKLPVAFLKDGKIVVEYKDKTTKVISEKEILKLTTF